MLVARRAGRLFAAAGIGGMLLALSPGLLSPRSAALSASAIDPGSGAEHVGQRLGHLTS